MKAYQIFQAISPDLGKSLFQDLREGHRDVYKSVLTSLATQRRLRPVFVQRKPAAQQIEWLFKTAKLKPVNEVSEHMLQVWLLQSQKDMLTQFLEQLGIEHDDDGTVEDLPDSLDDKKLKKGVDTLLKNHPSEHVALYLHVFQLQRPGGWENLGALLESDDRLALGEPAQKEESKAPAKKSAAKKKEETAPAEGDSSEEEEIPAAETGPEDSTSASPEPDSAEAVR